MKDEAPIILRRTKHGLEALDAEVWKRVPSKLGIMASSHGRLKMPVVRVKMPYGGECIRKTRPVLGTIMLPYKGKAQPRRKVYSRKFGNMLVHQLICEAFNGPRPFVKAVAIHIDENSLNNFASNLKWGTQKENLNMPKFISGLKKRLKTQKRKGWRKREGHASNNSSQN